MLIINMHAIIVLYWKPIRQPQHECMMLARSCSHLAIALAAAASATQ